MAKIYFIYQATNPQNNKIFISYYSGLSIPKKIRINNRDFKNDIKINNIQPIINILEYFNDKDSMLKKYNLIVNRDFRKRSDTYNFKKESDIIGVIDKNGNHFKISKSDPGYLSGEFKHFNVNKVVVKDNHGNNLKVNINDPRYINGELTHINKGKILAKDKEGKIIRITRQEFDLNNYQGIQKNKVTVRDVSRNIFSIDINNKSYKAGEYKSINKGKIPVKYNNKNIQINIEQFDPSIHTHLFKNKTVVKDTSGNIFSIDCDDPRFKSGCLKHININKTVVKDSSGNTFSVYTNDVRFKSGELVSIHKNKVMVIDNHKIKKVDKIESEKYELFKPVKNIKKMVLNHNKTYEEKLSNKYNLQINNDNGIFTINNYCKHGDVVISKHLFYSLINYGDKILCDICLDDILNNFKISDEEHISNKYFLKNLIENQKLKAAHFFNQLFLKRHYPKLFKAIEEYSYTNNINERNLYEKMYAYTYNIVPKKCKIKDCNTMSFFSVPQKKYNNYCENHLKYNFSSYKENELLDYIKSIYSNEKILERYKKIGKELDIYIPNLNVAFEFNGTYWHSDEYRDKMYHYNKWKLCKDNGIKLITIWEDDWNYKTDIVKSIIKNVLNLSDNIINAEKCLIKKIKYKDSKLFLEKNHLQGNCNALIRIGLYHNNEIISLMTFRKKRIDSNIKNKGDYELLRFCTALNTYVINGMSTLFKYFIDNYHPKLIATYASCEVSNHDLYENLNFKFKNIIKVNYWWSKNFIKQYRGSFMKQRLIKQGADPKKSEDEIMRQWGYKKIWETGNLLYEYVNS